MSQDKVKGPRKALLIVLCTVLVVLGITLGAFYIFIYKPSSSPVDVRISNITDSGATVSWLTSEEVTGYVEYTLDGKEYLKAYDTRDVAVAQASVYGDSNTNSLVNDEKILKTLEKQQLTSSNIHHIDISDLVENSSYSFKVCTGMKCYDEKGIVKTGVQEENFPLIENFSFTTLQALESISTPLPLYGSIVKLEESKDSKISNRDDIESILYVYVYDEIGNKSTATYSTVSTNEGGWLIDSANWRDSNGEVFSSEDGEYFYNLYAKSGSFGEGGIIVSYDEEAPLPEIYLIGESSITSKVIKNFFNMSWLSFDSNAANCLIYKNSDDCTMNNCNWLGGICSPTSVYEYNPNTSAQVTLENLVDDFKSSNSNATAVDPNYLVTADTGKEESSNGHLFVKAVTKKDSVEAALAQLDNVMAQTPDKEVVDFVEKEAQQACSFARSGASTDGSDSSTNEVAEVLDSEENKGFLSKLISAVFGQNSSTDDTTDEGQEYCKTGGVDAQVGTCIDSGFKDFDCTNLVSVPTDELFFYKWDGYGSNATCYAYIGLRVDISTIGEDKLTTEVKALAESNEQTLREGDKFYPDLGYRRYATNAEHCGTIMPAVGLCQDTVDMFNALATAGEEYYGAYQAAVNTCDELFSSSLGTAGVIGGKYSNNDIGYQACLDDEFADNGINLSPAVVSDLSYKEEDIKNWVLNNKNSDEYDCQDNGTCFYADLNECLNTEGKTIFDCRSELENVLQNDFDDFYNTLALSYGDNISNYLNIEGYFKGRKFDNNGNVVDTCLRRNGLGQTTEVDMMFCDQSIDLSTENDNYYAELVARGGAGLEYIVDQYTGVAYLKNGNSGAIQYVNDPDVIKALAGQKYDEINGNCSDLASELQQGCQEARTAYIDNAKYQACLIASNPTNADRLASSEADSYTAASTCKEPSAMVPSYNPSLYSQDTSILGAVVSKAYAQEEENIFKFDDGNNPYIAYFPEDGTYNFEIGNYSVNNVVAKEDSPYTFYYDMDRNGIFNENQDILVPVAGLNVNLEKISEVHTYQIKKGINIVSFPFMPSKNGSSAMMASELLDIANSLVPNIEAISYFRGGDWKGGYRKVNGVSAGTDFALGFGKGYVIVSNRDFSLDIPGYDVASEVPIAFSSGWNLVGVHGYPTVYTAESFLDSINSIDGLNANNITYWDTSLGKYEGLQKDGESTYGFDYNILDNLGYFVRIDEFNPSGDGVKSLIWQPGGSMNGQSGSIETE